MKITIDSENNQLIIDDGISQKSLPLYCKTSFEILSDIWTKVGWNEKYVYTFSWMGRPIIQLPEDLIRIQEVIYQIKPDVIVETGVAHGGSLIYYASLCKAMEKGRVIGIDIEIRPHNRRAIEGHELYPYITLIEGDSAAADTINTVKSMIKKEETVLVILDSCHSKDHVKKELEAYHPFVSSGSYIVSTDGIMKELHDVPRGEKGWIEDNPCTAVLEFAKEHPEFTLEQPAWLFNESSLTQNVTHWPSAWLKRMKEDE
ncbi:cephalosporin hydroxylase family protein [Neobacillus sp. GCM10023253]|uniref:cephalosporin hydroxylase family protein n=1 Tax=Neobacillus sp. GCM10023253 TaxID=3252644 RepID=UPI00360C4558